MTTLVQSDTREAVAIFEAEDVLRDAVDELQVAGFDIADLSVLLPGGMVKEHSGHDALAAANGSGVAQMDLQSMGVFQWSLISVPAYIVACIVIANAAAGGASLGATVIAAIIGCGIGGILGAFLMAWVKRGPRWRIKEHVDHGSLLLSVITRDTKREKRVSEILARYPLRDLHFHSLPEATSGKP